jgi:hypothetical protein
MISRWAILGTAAVVLAIGGLGCHDVQPLQFKHTPAEETELGKKITLEETPQEVHDFVQKSYPDAEILEVREITHSPPRVRNFEVTMMLPGGRKKVIDYNVFPRRSPTVTEIPAAEPKGAGSTSSK